MSFSLSTLFKRVILLENNPIISKESEPMTPLSGKDLTDALLMYKVYNELSFDYKTEFEAILTKTLD